VCKREIEIERGEREGERREKREDRKRERERERQTALKRMQFITVQSCSQKPSSVEKHKRNKTIMLGRVLFILKYRYNLNSGISRAFYLSKNHAFDTSPSFLSFRSTKHK
jgi:hypothetical protein